MLDGLGVAVAYIQSQEGTMHDPKISTMRAGVRPIGRDEVRAQRATDAEDVTQEAMLLAHRYRDSFRGESRYSTWLYRVTATAALMFLRKQRRLRARCRRATPTDDDGTPLLERHASRPRRPSPR